MKVISDSSPLIGLSSIGKLDILKNLWKDIIVPKAVFSEVVINGKGKIGSEEVRIACKSWIQVVKVQNQPEIQALQTVLDWGEAEVITLAQEVSSDLLLIDNREPRRFAISLEFDVLGTVGIIKLAWKKNIINDPLKYINELRLKGFWIDDLIIIKITAEMIASNAQPEASLPSKGTLSTPTPNLKKISQDDLIKHIIDVLRKLGGRARKKEVEEKMYEVLRDIFEQPYYQESYPSGKIRWENQIAWAREDAKKMGLIKQPKESGRGYWELTDKGMQFAR